MKETSHILILFAFNLIMPTCMMSQGNRPPEFALMQHRIDSVRRLDSIAPIPLNDIDYKKVPRAEWDKVVEEIVQMERNDQSHRQEQWTQSNGLAAKQGNIDSLNTLRLIAITRKYGYPNPLRMQKKASATLILLHSPPCFSEELNELLGKECKAGNIGREEYEILRWHFRGRPGQTFSIMPK